jgi:hypothetical protein
MPTIDRREILDRESYEQVRPEVRRRVMLAKDRRRVLVGDHCSVHFESRETMLYQVHEMLRAEGSWDRAGALDDELEAYNPLVPGAGELSATVMFEYETAAERAVFLPRLVGIERHLALKIGETPPVLGRFDRGQIDEHKVSSVQYVRFPLTDEQRRLLKEDGTVVRLVLDHPALQGQAVVGEATRREIMNDPD